MVASFEKRIPNPIVDDREIRLLQSLTDRYAKLIQPGPVKRLGGNIAKALPKSARSIGDTVKNTVTEQQLYEHALTIIGTGFDAIREQAARFGVSDERIIEQVGATVDGGIQSLDEICLARAYDIAGIVAKYRTGNLAAAFVEGAATGVPGFAGIPFNLVLSTFLYFRVVQIVARLYGYDVRHDTTEMEIAGQVFANSMTPTADGDDNDIAATISTIMATNGTEALTQTAAVKTWTDMATRGGTNLLLTQLSSLATQASKKALARIGKNEVETSVFRTVFKQVGRRLALKFVQRAIPVVSGAIGAFSDAGQMRDAINYADIFYAKRFILEKQKRITALAAHASTPPRHASDDDAFSR